MTSAASSFNHLPVLSQELISGLQVRPGGHYLDATIGGGGHSLLILEAAPGVKITGIDRDFAAITFLQNHRPQISELWQGNFADYQPFPGLQFDGIIADLGVSSHQFDTAARGFSFQKEAPLDMRMDTSQSLTAATIINRYGEAELAKIFYEYGEERLSRRIASAIVQKRPFKTTTELANLINQVVPSKYRHGAINPATRVFQALRLVVNQELESLEKFLQIAPQWLKVGGRIGIISFHSLEDRIVKHRFRESPLLEVITSKPISPQPEEVQKNRRSRSAKLRFAQKINQ